MVTTVAVRHWMTPVQRALDKVVGPPADMQGDVERVRARRVTSAALILCVLWAGAAIVVPSIYSATGDVALLTAILVAPAAASFLAYALSRSQYTLVAAGSLAGIAAVGTLVGASYHPDLAAPISLLFMFASLLVLAVLFLPLAHAFSLAALNYLGAMALPRWLPDAGANAVEIPYVFLAINLGLFVVLAPLRHRDETAAQEGRRLAERSASLAQEHAQTAGKLAQTAQLKGELLRVASHEVRSPLSVIALQLDLVRSASPQPLSPGQQRSMDIIQRNIKRASALLDALLDQARLEAGVFPLRTQEVNLAALTQEAQEALGATAAEYGVALEVRAEPTPVRADPLRVSQVLYNLMGNAIKFTPAGGTVRVDVACTDTGAQVTVTDTGAGMSPDQIAQLFQPFGGVHEPPAGRKLGTGLGLAISRGLVERHGGKIWAESAGPGHGSRFCFTLPAAPVQAVPATQSASNSQVAVAA